MRGYRYTAAVEKLLILLPVLILSLFVAFPVIFLVAGSFLTDGGWRETYGAVYSSSVNLRALGNTLWFSLVVMATSLAAAFPLAWLTVRTNLPGRRYFHRILTASYMLPPHVGAVAWIQLLSPGVGYLNQFLMNWLDLAYSPFDIYSGGGLIWCLTLAHSPIAYITIAGALHRMDASLEEASRASGASALSTLCRVTLPVMFPSLIAGGILVFVTVGSAYGVPAMIGVPAQIDVLTTRIMTYVYLGTDQGIQQATALAVSLLLAANAVSYGAVWAAGRNTSVVVGGKAARPGMVDLGIGRWLVAAAIFACLCITVFLPCLTVLVTSLLKSLSRPIMIDNLTLANWLAVLTNSQYLAPLWNSLLIAGLAATVSVLLGFGVAYLSVRTRAAGGTIADLLAGFGGATPGIVLALALILAFSGRFGLNLYGTLSILVVGCVIKYLIMAVRTQSAAFMQIHLSLEEAAGSSGAGRLRILRDIVMPLMSASMLASWFLVFMPSFYELTMSNVLYSARTKTVGVLLYELQTYADPQDAAVLAVMILLAVFTGGIVLSRLAKQV